MPLMSGYPHPELLETVDWLAAHLDDPDLRIIDSRTAAEYDAGHIAGAINLPAFGGKGVPTPFKATASFETGSPEEFAETVGQLGIRVTDTVICYDSAGPMAARNWWAFRRFGHPEVRFLHGGLRAWEAAGHPTVTTATQLPPARYELQPTVDSLACTLPQAVAALEADDVVFWDTRSAEEFSGERALNNPADRVGHIPGAVHLEWTELVDPDTGLFKPESELREILAAKGITPEKEILTY